MLQDLQQLRSFTPDNYDLDELVALRAYGASLAAAYSSFGLETPEWLTETNGRLAKEVEDRSRDMLERELRETENRIEALKTADEKRTDLKGKAERLKAKLAKAPATT